ESVCVQPSVSVKSTTYHPAARSVSSGPSSAGSCQVIVIPGTSVLSAVIFPSLPPAQVTSWTCQDTWGAGITCTESSCSTTQRPVAALTWIVIGPASIGAWTVTSAPVSMVSPTAQKKLSASLPSSWK